ncbi:unnamed protein product [Ilex paraguariensis]|uniref:Uncharacterized protein n=1 Tax=Ilex paraguariensis TaxID=185542 RepID=A0ABC8TNS3_9AQUA
MPLPHGVPDWRVCRLHGFPFFGLLLKPSSADLRLGRLRGSTLAFHWFLPGAFIVRIARASSSNRGRRRVHRRGGPGNESPFPRALGLLRLNKKGSILFNRSVGETWQPAQSLTFSGPGRKPDFPSFPQQARRLGGRRSGSHVWQLLEQTPKPKGTYLEKKETHHSLVKEERERTNWWSPVPGGQNSTT